MTIQSDRWIREQALEARMIEPFVENQVSDGLISYGLSSYGYDLRVSDEFRIFTNVNSAIIDPKAFDERSFVSVQADSVIIPPNSFALARSVEYFRIPADVLTICVGKSTYARCGIIVNVTPFEPEWEGFASTGDFQHYSVTRKDLCQRRFVSDFILPRSGALFDQLCRTQWKVSESKRNCIA